MYSRTSIIRISIIQTLSYLNTILKSQKNNLIMYLQNQVINEMSVWFLDLLGLLYHSTVGRKHINMYDIVGHPRNLLTVVCKTLLYIAS